MSYICVKDKAVFLLDHLPTIINKYQNRLVEKDHVDQVLESSDSSLPLVLWKGY